MSEPIHSEEEDRRLQALKAYHIMDSETEQSYNDIVKMAAWIADMPYASITLIDQDRQWFKASVGLPFRESERSVAFCSHTIRSAQPFIVEDTTLDSRFVSNPLVVNEPHIHAYIGIPLSTNDGLRIGALAVMDRKARSLKADQLEMLSALARQTMILLEMRMQQIELQQTQQRIAEQAALLDQTNDAVILRSLGHEIRFWNLGAEKIYGWTKDEIVGKSIASLHYDDPEPFHKATAQVVKNGQWVGELQHRTKTGKRLTIQGRWTLIRDEMGEPQSILAINTDVSSQKKLEMQFMRAQRMESIGTLAGGIAHDLNNLLSPIVMGVDLLKRDQPEGPAAEILRNIELSAKRGADLVRQVLSFARGVDSARIEVNPKHIINEARTIATNTFPKSIRTETFFPNELWPVLADPTQLNQVLLNLCLNARDAMPDGGELTILAENVQLKSSTVSIYDNVEPGAFVKIEIADTGCGMAKEVADRVFEPFFTTKELSKGTGLGLSTVLGIVRGHRGFVTVYSEEGKGSSFKVYLPAAIEPDKDSSAAIETADLPRGKGQCILVVDDETSILEMTRQTLEAFNYRVITAEDGAQAVGLFAVHAKEIDAVITDMMMPYMDGAALIKALRGINPQLPILAASGMAANGTVAKATSLGVKDFLPKPFSADSLLTAINKVLNTP